MKLLTKDQQESYENAIICYICKEKFENKYLKDKKYSKVKDFFFLSGFSFTTIHEPQDCRERGMAFL